MRRKNLDETLFEGLDEVLDKRLSERLDGRSFERAMCWTKKQWFWNIFWRRIFVRLFAQSFSQSSVELFILESIGFFWRALKLTLRASLRASARAPKIAPQKTILGHAHYNLNLFWPELKYICCSIYFIFLFLSKCHAGKNFRDIFWRSNPVRIEDARMRVQWECTK